MQAEFNAKAEKVVNTDEYRRIRQDMEWKQMNWKEKMFQAFVSDPYNAWLFVKTGVTGAVDQIMKRGAGEPGNLYVDTFNKSMHGTTYMDRTKFEAENAFWLKNGVSKSFQEKSARIAAEAFEQARDFSVLVKTGQLKRLDLNAG